MISMASEDIIAEEVIEKVVRTVPLRMSLIGAAMTFAGGCLIGYAWTEGRLRTKYQEIAEEEIEAMRDHFRSKAIAREEKPAVEEIIAEQGYVAPPIPQKEEVTGTSLKKARDIAKENSEDLEQQELAEEAERRVNVFELHGDTDVEESDEWDYEEETRMRRPDYPYVIHVDERGELAEMDQLTWTYYEGDEVLCNASDEVVTDVDRSVGLSNLDKFGHGSGEQNVVIVRNVVLGIEIEIVRSPGRYDEEVLGLQHADESARRRKRSFDDDSVE
jgi:hypothetical protein